MIGGEQPVTEIRLSRGARDAVEETDNGICDELGLAAVAPMRRHSDPRPSRNYTGGGAGDALDPALARRAVCPRLRMDLHEASEEMSRSTEGMSRAMVSTYAIADDSVANGSE